MSFLIYLVMLIYNSIMFAHCYLCFVIDLIDVDCVCCVLFRLLLIICDCASFDLLNSCFIYNTSATSSILHRLAGCAVSILYIYT